MLGWVLLYFSTLHFYCVAAQGDCTDLRGRVISHGLHYVPGPDTCTLCVCDNGVPKVCKAVLCSPPQDCRSFRVGTTCCEFICLDDVVKPADTSEVDVRVAAAGVSAVMLLTVGFVVYRVRQQKLRRPPHADDQRSLTSIGYISGSMGYMGGTCETALASWKPPGIYLPPGEAPPPYDEAVAHCRPEQMRLSNDMGLRYSLWILSGSKYQLFRRMISEPPYHRTYPATMETMARPEETLPCSGHGYANIPRPLPQMPNPQNCYNAPLLQTVHAPEHRDPNQMPHHVLPPNVVGFPSAIRLTGSLGAISNRGLLSLLQREPEREREHERPHNVPGFYTNTSNMHTSLHRTIPRISTAVDTTLLDSAISGFARGDRSLHAEVRRSFHKPGEARHLADTGRSMPRNLNLAASADGARAEPALDTSHMRLMGGERSRAHSEEQNVGSAEPKPVAKPAGKPTAQPGTEACPPQTLPLTVDKPSCVCSYSSAGAQASAEDADDYRSECENCKSASSSRWVLDEGWDGEQEDGTQTLQRRAPPPAPPPPATATLPQPVTKPTRTALGPACNWENWFSAIPDSESDSEEE